MPDGDIASIGFHKLVQDVEKYTNLKADVRKQAKTKVRQTIKEQREKLLGQKRKETKDHFLQTIITTSGTQGVNVI